jgi:MraZ protein
VVENGSAALKMAKPAPTPIIYAGEFRHAVDAKHRVTVPSRWRSDGGQEDFFAVPDPAGNFLMILPPHEFDRVKADVEANALITPADRRKFIRRFYALAQLVSVDKQGRILLPEEYCRRLGLEGEVVLIGSHSRMEIWNTQRWSDATAAEEEVFRRVAGEVGL